MPAKLDRCVKKLMDQGKSKSSAFAICQAEQGTQMDVKENKNWKHVEFYSPIAESFVSNNKEFFIKGVAINETTTRNGITYISEELEKAAPSFRNKPILKDHNNSIESIVGRTTENVHFENSSDGKGRIMFEAQIMDKQMQEMIKDGRIQNVSIGTMLEDLREDEEAGTVTAIGMEGLEISLVAVPGDGGAGLTHALRESLNLKKKEIVIENANKDILTKLQTEDVMETKVEKLQTVEAVDATVKAEKIVDNDAQEKMNVMAAELAKYKAKEEAEKFSKAVAAEVKKQLENAQPLEEETPAKTPVEDETQGTVGTEPSENDDEVEEGLVVERAETGKGFAMYRNYTSENAGKFKRLCRD
jgi:hypothetical protein